MIGQQLPYLNHLQVTQFIANHVAHSNWHIDLGSLNWYFFNVLQIHLLRISYLLTHRTLPQPDDQSNIIAMFTRTFLAQGPQGISIQYFIEFKFNFLKK